MLFALHLCMHTTCTMSLLYTHINIHGIECIKWTYQIFCPHLRANPLCLLCCCNGLESRAYMIIYDCLCMRNVSLMKTKLSVTSSFCSKLLLTYYLTCMKNNCWMAHTHKPGTFPFLTNEHHPFAILIWLIWYPTVLKIVRDAAHFNDLGIFFASVLL